jgi:hypothetical protein
MSGVTRDPKQIGLVLPFTMTTGMVAMEVASALSLMTIPFPGRQIGLGIVADRSAMRS